MATSGSQNASRKTNGVIAVSGQQSTATEAPKSSRSRAPVEGHKVVIRRLPPGLTEEELWSKLGEEWKAGQGLASWHNYEPGKIQTDPAKISKPARLYLHVLKRENLSNLSNLIQAKSWEDAKMSSNNPCLVGPPILEYASYPKIPSAKKRSDPRQGTIDQDPEFMAFLQSLTNPDQDKEAETGENKEAEEPKAETKVTTTPLIEYLKEKKANKAKEAAAAKSAKQSRQESQSTKGKASASTTEDTKKGKKESKSDKSADKPKETVKILTKKATADAVKAAETVASQITQSSSATQEVPKSRRAGIAAAARILQRDLGISPGSAHRRARLDAAKAEAEAKATASKEPAQPVAEKPAPAQPAAAPPAPSSSNTTQTSERNAASSSSKSGRTRRGGGSKNASSNEKGKSNEASSSSNTPAPPKAPVVLLKKKDEEKNKDKAERAERAEKAEKADKADKSAPSKSNPPTGPKGSGKGGNSKKGGSSSSVGTGATRGFVKHANPSQGVTEALLKQAMEAFGIVTFVEIDKRKGFAYVDFSNHDGLAKAIAASPITVAQGTVQVLERKEKKPAAGNSNSNANAGSSSSAPAAAASASESKSNKDKEKEANAPEKMDEPRHKRTRRGRGSGKSGANKDAQQGGDKGAGAAAG
ncbi:nonsense-mediated mRNA decay protein [Colletotrichum musicola]|uniref:Nonsense-mediated mRNA decay protein n=1 Tax=Colletotrichum musicola TaxID=2175873 RepID=A0A8H6JD89_9PEZI|nr:nonsense-mediated mRNA decay protein [Colletotrichum musicola]